MDRRAFIVGGVAVLAAPLAAGAQQAGKVYRIGFLFIGSRGASEHLLQAFEQAVRERGGETGQNLVIEYRSVEGNYDQLSALAAGLVRLEPQVIVAVATAAARAAKDATSKIPIVMVNVTDPIGERLIASFARPGGNVTGLTFSQTRELYGKQLQLLREAVPRARRVAFLWNPANPAAAFDKVKTVEKAAWSLWVELQVVGARAPEEFEPAFRAMTHARADALLVIADSMFFLIEPGSPTSRSGTACPPCTAWSRMRRPAASWPMR